MGGNLTAGSPATASWLVAGLVPGIERTPLKDGTRRNRSAAPSRKVAEGIGHRFASVLTINERQKISTTGNFHPVVVIIASRIIGLCAITAIIAHSRGVSGGNALVSGQLGAKKIPEPPALSHLAVYCCRLNPDEDETHADGKAWRHGSADRVGFLLCAALCYAAWLTSIVFCATNGRAGVAGRSRDFLPGRESSTVSVSGSAAGDFEIPSPPPSFTAVANSLTRQRYTTTCCTHLRVNTSYCLPVKKTSCLQSYPSANSPGMGPRCGSTGCVSARNINNLLSRIRAYV